MQIDVFLENGKRETKEDKRKAPEVRSERQEVKQHTHINFLRKGKNHTPVLSLRL